MLTLLWLQLGASGSSEAEQTGANQHIVNILRGGVLYVTVRKPQQVLPGTPDLPSKASQVRSRPALMHRQMHCQKRPSSGCFLTFMRSPLSCNLKLRRILGAILLVLSSYAN